MESEIWAQSDVAAEHFKQFEVSLLSVEKLETTSFFFFVTKFIFLL